MKRKENCLQVSGRVKSFAENEGKRQGLPEVLHLLSKLVQTVPREGGSGPTSQLTANCKLYFCTSDPGCRLQIPFTRKSSKGSMKRFANLKLESAITITIELRKTNGGGGVYQGPRARKTEPREKLVRVAFLPEFWRWPCQGGLLKPNQSPAGATAEPPFKGRGNEVRKGQPLAGSRRKGLRKSQSLSSGQNQRK